MLSSSIGLAAVMAMSYPVVGAALHARSPGNRLALVLLLTGGSRAVAVSGVAWAGGAHPSRFGAGLASWLALGFQFVALVLAPLTLLWFPDGELPDPRRRWRLAQRAPVLAGCSLAVLMVLSWRYRGPALLDDSAPPGGVQGHLVVAALITCVVVSVCGIAAGVVSLLARWRSQQGVIRQQLKWYLAGAVAAVLLNVAGDLLPGARYLNLLGTVVLMAAILIAVVRHNLWDIDRILNRTVVYGALSTILAALYIGSVLALGLLLNDLSNGQGLAIAAATLSVATVAGPLRRRLQQQVDRRFDRRTFDAVSLVARHVAEAAVRPPVPGETEALLSLVLRDPSLEVFYRCQDGQHVDGWGRPRDEAARDGSEHSELGALPYDVGVLVHAPISPPDLPVWEAALRAAQPLLRQCRLQAEVLVQVAALERSRTRIVEAADGERRRIERNLHDGAQQRLVSLALRLRSEQRRHGEQLGPQGLRMIDESVEELRGAVEDLRTLAAGLLPGSLVSEGLSPALMEIAARHPHGVRVLNLLDHRHAQSVEEVAWFVAAEGVANAVKYAPDAVVSIEVRCAQGCLTLVVRDDGGGGAVVGSGLTGLQDRVRASSGTLVLDSPAGLGTALSLVLPCG